MVHNFCEWGLTLQIIWMVSTSYGRQINTPHNLTPLFTATQATTHTHTHVLSFKATFKAVRIFGSQQTNVNKLHTLPCHSASEIHKLLTFYTLGVYSQSNFYIQLLSWISTSNFYLVLLHPTSISTFYIQLLSRPSTSNFYLDLLHPTSILNFYIQLLSRTSTSNLYLELLHPTSTYKGSQQFTNRQSVCVSMFTPNCYNYNKLMCRMTSFRPTVIIWTHTKHEEGAI